ncbi:MAG: cell division protein ZapB [Gammaproteobacteria bacterium]|nr:cell division protein ZapB [Gammaproteobacteria bacterium]
MRYTALQMLTLLPTSCFPVAALRDTPRTVWVEPARPVAQPPPGSDGAVGTIVPGWCGRLLAGICLTLSVTACVNPAPQGGDGSAAAGASTAGDASVAAPVEPELTLNLPHEQQCECTPEQVVDHTFLEKGFDALRAGDHIEAITYFQRYQRTESSRRADWEAGIAIAYDSMLAQSPFYDPAEASKRYESLDASAVDMATVHSKVLMMRDALATFTALQAEIRALQQNNAQLTDDLARREEALKRLRELALGQRGATP